MSDGYISHLCEIFNSGSHGEVCELLFIEDDGELMLNITKSKLHSKMYRS